MEPESMVIPVCEETKEKDSRPEYTQYRDEGCELSGSCLQCNLTQCIYDRPRGKHRMLKTVRDRQMVALFHAGKATADLAKIFGVCQRTVQRILRKSKSQETNTKKPPMSQIPISVV